MLSVGSDEPPRLLAASPSRQLAPLRPPARLSSSLLGHALHLAASWLIETSLSAWSEAAFGASEGAGGEGARLPASPSR